MRAVASHVISQVRRGRTPEQPTIEVEGPIRPRDVVVDAPLLIRGEVRLPASRLGAAVVTGGSLVRRGDHVAIRFSLVLGGPKASRGRISLTGSVREASFPRVVVTAAPSAVPALATAVGRRNAVGATTRLLLSLARVRQYDAFLANPAPGGSVDAVYRFRTVEQPAVAVAALAPDDDGVAGTALVLLLAVLGAGGLAVLWAHL